ncbi:hypothetical protein AGMMS49975_21070 [Clostridia bacterium]|nr:hypothetical protein AGMMS49975_21070 [Clostridia bacterium]
MSNGIKNLNLKPYDDIFNTEESRADMAREKIVEVAVGELHTFANHPFKILDDDAMQNIVESVRQYGVLVPAI